MNTYTAVLRHNPKDGWWTAVCAEVPAAISQGRTAKEARANLAEALTLVLVTQRVEVLREAGKRARIEKVSVTAP
jgi:predicted RNase H-like HicB family nuclease